MNDQGLIRYGFDPQDHIEIDAGLGEAVVADERLEALDPADYGTQEEYEYDRQELQRTLDYNIECYAEAPEDYDLEEWDGDLGREFAGVMSPVPGERSVSDAQLASGSRSASVPVVPPSSAA